MNKIVIKEENEEEREEKEILEIIEILNLASFWGKSVEEQEEIIRRFFGKIELVEEEFALTRIRGTGKRRFAEIIKIRKEQQEACPQCQGRGCKACRNTGRFTYW